MFLFEPFVFIHFLFSWLQSLLFNFCFSLKHQTLLLTLFPCSNPMAHHRDLREDRDPWIPAIPPPLPPSSPRDLTNLPQHHTVPLDDSLSRFHLDEAMQRQLRPLFRHALSAYTPAHYIPAPRYPHGQSFNEFSVILNIQFFNLTELWFLTHVGDMARYHEVDEWRRHLRPWGSRRIRNTPPETLERQFTFTHGQFDPRTSLCNGLDGKM